MRNTGNHIVIPSYNGREGHPIALLSQTVKELIQWKGAGGLRSAINAYSSGPKGILEAGDSGILFAADTPEEYQVLMRASQSQDRARLPGVSKTSTA
jgi:CTP:molybdopterin cytidylyltransferase MocA